MAIRQSTSKGTGARSRLPRRMLGVRLTGPVGGSRKTPSALEEILARQLVHLAQAESVLGCLRVALLYEEDRGRTSDPDYARTAGVALKLIREVADTLDSSNVRPLIDALHGAPAAHRRPTAKPRRR